MDKNYNLQRKTRDGHWLTMRQSSGEAYSFPSIEDAFWHRRFWSSDAVQTNEFQIVDVSTGEIVA